MARKSSCSSCKRLRAQVRALQAQLDALRATVADLQQQLASARKDSSTSSKPPSSDIIKPPSPPPPEGQARRSIGGQPGHPRHERPLLGPELLNGGSHTHVPEICPQCGHGLQVSPLSPRVVQQIDIATGLLGRPRWDFLNPGLLPNEDERGPKEWRFAVTHQR